MKEKIGKAFEASLSFFGEEKVSNYSLQEEDLIIEKYAGVTIYQPTEENIELFVNKYTLNEMAFSPKMPRISIHLHPEIYSKTNKRYIDRASGVTEIGIGKTKVELPFVIVEGEFNPYDVIKLDKQRVPYTRENIKKVVLGVLAAEDKKDKAVEEFTPFLSTEKLVNPATSVGFLGDALKIQDRHIGRTNAGGNLYVTSSEFLDTSMEKLADMRPMTKEDMDKIQEVIKTAYTQSMLEGIKKEAADAQSADEKDSVRMFSNLRSVEWKDANSVPNGAAISFPEITDNSMCLQQGIVASDFLESNPSIKGKKLVITKDGRMKILEKGNKFLCSRISDQGIKIPTKNFSSLKPEDTFIAFNGDKCIGPYHVCHADKELGRFSVYPVFGSDKERLYTENNTNIEKDDAPTFSGNRLAIYFLKGQKFNRMPLSSFVEEKRKEVKTEKEKECLNHFNSDNFLAVDPEVKIIIIKSPVYDTVKDVNEIINFGVSKDSELFKHASNTEYLELRLADKEKDLYNLRIVHTDKTKKVFKTVDRKFDKIPVHHVRGILKAIGLPLEKIAEVVGRAKSANFARFELDNTMTPSRVVGGELSGPVNKAMKRIKDAIYDSGISDQMMTQITGSLLGSIAKNSDALTDVLRKISSESKALSSVFEKVAIDRKSESMTCVAKVTAINAMLSEKVATIVNGSAQYMKLNDVVKEIVENVPLLEKMASDLIDLKHAQLQNGNVIVNPGYIQAAVRQVDNLYKIASCLNGYKKQG